jgi:hypothetical protein
MAREIRTMTSMRTVIALLAALLLLAGPAGSQEPGRFEVSRQDDDQDYSRPPLPPEYVISSDVEQFRLQLLEFMNEMEAVVQLALEHPVIAEQFRARMGSRAIQFPLPQEYYDLIDLAEPDDLKMMQEAFMQTPQILSIPDMLSSVLAELQVATPLNESASGDYDGARDSKLSCSDNYNEFRNLLSKRSTRKSLVRARNGIKLSSIFLQSLADSLRATLEDVPIIGSKPSIPEYVVWGAVAAAEASLDIAINEMTRSIEESQLCIDACLVDGDISGQDSKSYRGKGCDNRDNNCRDGIDEPYEDLFRPVIEIDPALIEVCYPSPESALEAAERAVTAEDDCDLASFSVNVIPDICSGTVSAVAQDANPMTAPAGRMVDVSIDGEPPLIAPPALEACYDTLAAARAAMWATPVTDNCSSSVDTYVEILENECVADLALEATDSCGNRSLMEARTLVDGTPPHVRIKSLIIPSVNGLACFDSESAAIDTVSEATLITDNCTPAEELIFETTTEGDLCNLEIISSATDECEHLGSDSLVVRVDSEPPSIACTVGQEILWPPDDRMVDIGFVLDVHDNCDGEHPRLAVMVTSDEPTRFAYLTSNDPIEDPYPDAIVERTEEGGISRILLRAQRRQTGGYDGRVYRIRVTATDSCGLSSETECWVTVPPTPGQGTAVNSGQIHDATELN